MSKEYTALGLMSGTSGDGVDASIVQSDGKTKYRLILNKLFKYDENIFKNIHSLKSKIRKSKDLNILKNELIDLEKKITLFHAKAVESLNYKSIDFLGFHGQTIFHNSTEKISKQLGDAKLLSQLTKKSIIYKFRENDLKNNGEGAPLAPIFHKLLVNKNKIKLPVVILNIGGIANLTLIDNDNKIFSTDIGPGNCLIDAWLRFNSKKNFDKDGEIARSGKINTIILNQAIENFNLDNLELNKSFDINDFDLAFVRGLSLEDGAATLTEFTAQICSRRIKNNNIYVCGGGRKNKFLLESIKEKINGNIKLIDELSIDGDFIESQAFGYLAIRSYLGLPISYPETTGVNKPCSGGIIIRAK